MNSKRKQQITSIFHSAIEREGAERRAFLDGACANDAELRREVESLIHSHENAGSLMDPPAYERDASLVDEMDQTAAVPKPPMRPTSTQRFKSDFIAYFSYSRDGRQLALARGSTTRDAVLISDEK